MSVQEQSKSTSSASDRPIIEIKNVSKIYGGGVKAVDNVNLTVSRGEFFALLGPSGCGKTTLLRMLAGFETPSAGEVIIDGVDMSTVAPNKRPVNMVFQSYAVFPHMSVEKNVGYGLRMDGRPRGEIKQRTEEALALVKLAGYGKRMPNELSGGQQQRVAIARALANDPVLILADEPTGNLDSRNSKIVQEIFARLAREQGRTVIAVTHEESFARSTQRNVYLVDGHIARDERR
nr:hypothetical protein DBT41_12825 [Aerococcus urinae]